MSKIGIITLTGNDNYGNKLQHYATIKTVSKLNCDVETIWVTNPYKDTNTRQLMRYIKRKIEDNLLYHKRRKYFLHFNKYLNVKKNLIFDNDIKKVTQKYDYLVVGSDQVWNYNYFNNDSIYLLYDCPVVNGIAFSASFGISTLPAKYEQKYKNGLKNFKYISIREEQGKEIAEKLTKRKDIQVLVDPTMLLTDKEWDNISKKPKQLKKLNGKKYILNYFLGSLSEQRKKAIEKIAYENNCDIINILDRNDPFYQSGPSEFLYLEKHAFLICTDSFHSSVFAILYNRPFVVFDRENSNIANMNSRIDTLLSKFELTNRKYNGKYITKENLECDYTNAYKILEKEREKSMQFLKKALDIDNK